MRLAAEELPRPSRLFERLAASRRHIPFPCPTSDPGHIDCQFTTAYGFTHAICHSKGVGLGRPCTRAYPKARSGHVGADNSRLNTRVSLTRRERFVDGEANTHAPAVIGRCSARVVSRRGWRTSSQQHYEQRYQRPFSHQVPQCPKPMHLTLRFTGSGRGLRGPSTARAALP